MADVNLAVAHAVVMLSSFFALTSCWDLALPSLALTLYLLVGMLGLVDYLLKNNEHVWKAHKLLTRVSRPSYLPLLAAHALLSTKYHQFYWLPFIFPCAFLIMTELLNRTVRSDVLDASSLGCALAVGYAAFLQQDVAGGVCALLGLAAFVASRPLRHGYNTVEHLFLVAATNIAALQFLQHYFNI